MLSRGSDRLARVEAYAGGQGEEEPRTIEIDGQETAVREITARWREPTGTFFRVRTEDERSLLLQRREPELDWWLVAE